jgi:hypothetical protein
MWAYCSTNPGPEPLMVAVWVAVSFFMSLSGLPVLVYPFWVIQRSPIGQGQIHTNKVVFLNQNHKKTPLTSRLMRGGQ